MESMQEQVKDFSIHDFKPKTLKDNVKSNKNEEEIIDPLDKEILRPFKYLISVPGKNIRQNLIQALNHWLDIPCEKLNIISDLIFNLHNFSLLIDDIQDNSSLRRGVPAAHTIFNIGNTLNAANFVGCINTEKALSLNHPKAIKVAGNSLLEILAGQGMEIYWRDNFICPTEEEYLQMVTRKTGGIFHLANNLMQLFTTKNKNIDNFLTSIGLYFQINDDYQNLNSEVFFNSKGFCEDLTEGKFSFPIIHAINSGPIEGQLIKDILRQRTTDIKLKKHCLSLIEACGSFKYTRNKISELRRTIFEEIDKLGDNPFIDKFFEMIIAASL